MTTRRYYNLADPEPVAEALRLRGLGSWFFPRDQLFYLCDDVDPWIARTIRALPGGRLIVEGTLLRIATPAAREALSVAVQDKNNCPGAMATHVSVGPLTGTLMVKSSLTVPDRVGLTVPQLAGVIDFAAFRILTTLQQIHSVIELEGSATSEIPPEPEEVAHILYETTPPGIRHLWPYRDHDQAHAEGLPNSNSLGWD